MEIKKVAVIGAGVMGSGIAAHVTNAGIPVILLDIVPEGVDNRNIIAEAALAKLKKAAPAAFMHKKNAKLVTTGNIEDHLDLLQDVDWIIEVVIERLDIKQALYRKLEAIRKPGSVVSSNTSTIPLSLLTKGMPDQFSENFLITHFFNPPRYMPLLELIVSEKTRPDIIDTVRDFCDLKLGKGIVKCKDTPGFIGNRIGVFWLQCSVLEALKAGISIEEADAVIGRPMGIPKTGVFGLLDLIGLDLMPNILESMGANLPSADALHNISQIPEIIKKMLAEGYTGRKGKGGFYRLNKIDGEKVKESIDLLSGEYHTSSKPKHDSVAATKDGGLRSLLDYDDKTGRYAWRVLSQTICYAANLVSEIADDIVAIDETMKLGYNWQFGPFELLDQLGVKWFTEKLKADKLPVPALLEKAICLYRIDSKKLLYFDLKGNYLPIQRNPGVLLLADVKLHHKPLLTNQSGSLWDLDDGVVCLEFHSKMNALDLDIMELIKQCISLVTNDYKALVIHNDGEHFSAGANLGLLLSAIKSSDWSAVEQMIESGQEIYSALKYAPFPVVAAPSGLALGGGCEIMLHCDAIQAHAELYTGLVEVGVGLIPGWGGCKEMLLRWIANDRCPGGPMPPVIKSFETIATAAVSKSAAEARDLLFLRLGDQITMNKDRLLADAKQKALALSVDYTPPEVSELHLPGLSGKVALDMAVQTLRYQGKATEYDELVSGHLATVLSGNDADLVDVLSEADILKLEQIEFMKLVHEAGTVARLDHMLETGKPLRN